MRRQFLAASSSEQQNASVRGVGSTLYAQQVRTSCEDPDWGLSCFESTSSLARILLFLLFGATSQPQALQCSQQNLPSVVGTLLSRLRVLTRVLICLF